MDSSNKGFSMLQKMGYKPGSSLGKQGMYSASKLKHKTTSVNHIYWLETEKWLFVLRVGKIYYAGCA